MHQLISRGKQGIDLGKKTNCWYAIIPSFELTKLRVYNGKTDQVLRKTAYRKRSNKQTKEKTKDTQLEELHNAVGCNDRRLKVTRERTCRRSL